MTEDGGRRSDYGLRDDCGLRTQGSAVRKIIRGRQVLGALSPQSSVLSQEKD